MKKNSGSKVVRYNKWGYIFLIPFILVYVVFQLIPLFNTIYNSFFENYIEDLSPKEYARIYTELDISPKFLQYLKRQEENR